MTPRPTPNEISNLVSTLSLVGDFCSKFDVYVPMTWDDSRDDSRALWANLISEEFIELTEATTRIDRLDAMCDLLYVAQGAVLSVGLRGDAYKTFGINKPLTKAVTDAVFQLRKTSPCQAGCRNDTTSLAVTMLRAGNAMFTPEKFIGAFTAVHENNMAKLWTEDDLKHLPADCTQKPKVLGLNNVRFLVRRKEDGKIMKPPQHKKVDLTPYV